MPYNQAPKSAALKALIGNQKNLPEALKQKILDAPETPAKQTKVMVQKTTIDKKTGEKLEKTGSDKYKSPAKKYKKGC